VCLGYTSMIVSAAVTVATATVRTNVAHFVRYKSYFSMECCETGADRRGSDRDFMEVIRQYFFPCSFSI